MHSLYFNAMEKAYAKQYFKTNKRLIIIAMIILFLCMNDMFLPGQVLSKVISIFMNRGNGTFDYPVILQLIGCVCAFAFLLPLYQFRFLMKRSSSDLYLSLPIKRERFFYVQFILGVCLQVAITSCVFFINALLFGSSYQNGGFGISYNTISYCIMFIVIEVLGVCLYSFYTWLCVKCNTLSDAIVIMCCYTILPMVIHGALYQFSSHVSSRVLYSSSYSYDGLVDKPGLNNLIWILAGFLSVPWLMRSTIQIIAENVVYNAFGTGLALGYIASVLAWIIFGIMFFIFAKRIFKKRKSEESEFKTKSYLTYPILIPTITTCLLMFAGIYKENIIWIAVIFIGYLAMQFFANRSIKITGKILLEFLCSAFLVIGLELILINTSMFGSIHEYPEFHEISEVKINVNHYIFSEDNQQLDNHSCYSGEAIDQRLIEKALARHKELFPVSTKDQRTGEVYSFAFTYYLKDGDVMQRYYSIPQDFQPLAESITDTWLNENMIKLESYYEDSEAY